MATPKLDRTNTPGIFRRHVKDCPGRSVRVRLRDHLARSWPPAHRNAPHACRGPRGEASARGRRRAWRVLTGSTRDTLHDYARAWVDRYQGNGRRGFREETRRRVPGALLDKYALAYFPPRLPLFGSDAARGGRVHRLARQASERPRRHALGQDRAKRARPARRVSRRGET